jgi:hypothetical protein
VKVGCTAAAIVAFRTSAAGRGACQKVTRVGFRKALFIKIFAKGRASLHLVPNVVFSTSAKTFQPHVVKKVCFSRAIFTDLNPKPIGSVFSKCGVVWTFYSTFSIFFGRFGNVWANSLARDVRRIEK